MYGLRLDGCYSGVRVKGLVPGFLVFLGLAFFDMDKGFVLGKSDNFASLFLVLFAVCGVYLADKVNCILYALI